MEKNKESFVPIFIGILFFAFLLLLRNFISPFLLTLILLYLLYNYRKYGWSRSMFVVVAVVFFLWFLWRAKVVLTPFILGGIVAYIFNPLVDRLERINVRRTIGIVAIAIPIVLLIILIFLFFIPKLVDQLQDLFSKVPDYYKKIGDYFSTLLKNLSARGIIVEEKGLIDEAMKKSLPIIKNIISGAINLVKGITAVVTFVIYLFVVPIVSFYLMRDRDKIITKIDSLTPKRYKKTLRKLIHESGVVLSGYIRGQLLICLIVGVSTGFLLWFFGIDYFIILGVISGVLNIIPRIGFIISIIPAIIVGLLSANPLLGAVWVILTFIIVTIIETIVTPRVLSATIELHPLTVLLAVFMGAFFFGIVGLILAVPVVAFLKIFYTELETIYLKSPLYNR